MPTVLCLDDFTKGLSDAIELLRELNLPGYWSVDGHDCRIFQQALLR
jgi:hypothetical protein